MGGASSGIERTKVHRWLGWSLLVGLALGGCDAPKPPDPGTPSTASADEVPFVVFSEQKVIIEGIGTTALVPAAVGSTVSSRTLTSADPRIVEVTADGALRSRAPGRTTVRATGNPSQVLEVEVRVTSDQATAPAAFIPSR